MTMADGNIVIRLEPELKQKLIDLKAETGLSITELIKMMLIEFQSDGDRKYKVYRRKQK